MKILFCATAILCLSISLSASASDTAQPCQKIRSACEAAGFKKGEHKEGKGLVKDCLEKIKAGEAVAGVAVAPEDMAACNAKVANRKQKRMERRKVKLEGGAQMTPGKMNSGKN